MWTFPSFPPLLTQPIVAGQMQALYGGRGIRKKKMASNIKIRDLIEIWDSGARGIPGGVEGIIKIGDLIESGGKVTPDS